MNPYRLHRLTFSDGTSLEVPGNSIIVFVGPNNSGKSQALRDIESSHRRPDHELITVKDVKGEISCDFEGLKQWLGEHAHVYTRLGETFASRSNASELSMNTIKNWWNNGPPFHDFTEFLVQLAGTEQRLGMTGSVGTFDAMEQRPSNPLQELFLRADLEEALSEATSRAFGTPVTVNRVSGSNIHLHVGTVGTIPGPRDATNQAYLEALRQLRQIGQEGDGVRSYVGILLSTIVAKTPVVLIDEPEAFLHPPQAKQLGRELVKLIPRSDSQLLISTHSAEFVEGLLDDGSTTVTVVRLTRDGDINRAAILASQDLRGLWGDPILRYSALLDGLFHKGVVLCEADSDCRFYQATLDASLDRRERPAHDLLFTYTGGKARFPVAIRAMRAVDVDVQVIADLDVLDSGRKMKEIVQALDRDWALFERDFNIVHQAIGQMGRKPLVEQVKRDVGDELDKLQAGERLTSEQAKRIASGAKVESGWKRLKDAGVPSLPAGDATAAAGRLLTGLDDIGFHIVPVGETECWNKEIGGHGPDWVAAALAEGFHLQSGAHLEFAESVLPEGDREDAA